MASVKGNDIRLTVGATLIGGQQNCSLNMETETSETTTKDSGVWAESEAVGLSWAIDCDGLVVVDDEGLVALESAWEAMEAVDVKYGTATDFKSGKAIITSLSQNAPMKEKCTYTVSLQGVGPLTKKPVAVKSK